jgi:hypothetical protein
VTPGDARRIEEQFEIRIAAEHVFAFREPCAAGRP